jgi:hypothetical protein
MSAHLVAWTELVNPFESLLTFSPSWRLARLDVNRENPCMLSKTLLPLVSEKIYASNKAHVVVDFVGSLLIGVTITSSESDGLHLAAFRRELSDEIDGLRPPFAISSGRRR